MTPHSPKPRVLLDIRALDADEKARDELVGAIDKNAPSSTLFAGNPVIQAQVAAVKSTNATYKSALATAGASARQHATDVAAANTAKTAADKAIRLLADLVEHDAQTEAEITGMAFEAYAGKPPAPPLEPPVVDVTPGRKGSGKATAAAHETGRTRRKYAAESSVDGVTWSTLTGSGKSRKLAGKSGATIWVRFALQRGQLQSAWSNPVQITFP
jgi:hypothetical protein